MKNMYFFKWLWNNIEVDKVFSWHTFAPQWIYTDLWQTKSAQFYLVGVKIWYSSFDPALILPDSSVSSRGSTTFNSTVPDILLACIVLVYFINTFFFLLWWYWKERISWTCGSLLKRGIPITPPGVGLSGMRNEAHTSSQTTLGKHWFLELWASQKCGYSEAHQNPLWEINSFS